MRLKAGMNGSELSPPLVFVHSEDCTDDLIVSVKSEHGVNC